MDGIGTGSLGIVHSWWAKQCVLNEAEKFRKALQYAVNFDPGSILSVHLGRKALALYIEAK